MIPRQWLVYRRQASAEAHQSVSDPRVSPISHGSSDARSSSWRAAARSARMPESTALGSCFVTVIWDGPNIFNRVHRRTSRSRVFWRAGFAARRSGFGNARIEIKPRIEPRVR